MLGAKKTLFRGVVTDQPSVRVFYWLPGWMWREGNKNKNTTQAIPQASATIRVLLSFEFWKMWFFFAKLCLVFVWVVSVCETSSRYWIPPRGPLTRFDKGFLVASMTVRMLVSGGRVIALVAELCGTLISTLTTTFLLSLLCTITSTK